MSATFRPQAAETRANMNTMSSIRARSQLHDCVGLDRAQQVAGLLSRQHGVLPLPSFWRGHDVEKAAYRIAMQTEAWGENPATRIL
jgi:hypothetical protein